MSRTHTPPHAATIVIAEDSPTQAMNLQYLLEQHDYRVVVCDNGQQALAAVREHKPALVISDVVMPQMTGYELCRQLKADRALSGIPVLLVTSLNDPEDVLRGLEAGADSFILKPYDENFL
ncbi:MAG TPA: response regulator, partial [Lysobacter sp.]|nr:response regulator [Lysobacter sp.]